MRCVLFLAACIMILGCNGSRGMTYTVATPETPEEANRHAQAMLVTDVVTAVPGSQAEVTIATLPHWRDEGRRHEAGWYWDITTVTVHVTPAPGVTVDTDDVVLAVRKRLDGAIERGQPDLTVEVVVGEPAALSAPVTEAATAPRQYTVQTGDTLAQISAVFYGSAQHWRRIVEANPGLTPETLAPGQSLIIP